MALQVIQEVISGTETYEDDRQVEGAGKKWEKCASCIMKCHELLKSSVMVWVMGANGKARDIRK